MPKQARARATIEVVLESTAQILVRDGYEGLTTNHVARRAGVSVGSIYQYFRSKEGLVAALVDRHLELLMAVIATEIAAAAPLPFAEGSRRIIDALVHAQALHPDLHRAVLEQVPKVDRLGRIRELDRHFEVLLHAALESRAAELDVKDMRIFAFVIVHTAKAVTLAALVEHPEWLTDGSLAEELARMFARYAERRPAPEVRARPRVRSSRRAPSAT